jgi:MoxR-like ATPase
MTEFMSNPALSITQVPIRTLDGQECQHLLSASARDAIYGAIAAERPLLVRGEPGLGKSQLALAASSLLGRPYKTFTIDAHTEARDLLFSFDAVQRLAEAQVAASTFKDDAKGLRKAIREQRFVSPGPLWWALDWESANRQQRLATRSRVDEVPVFAHPVPPTDWSEQKGIVILIDEIDKADSSLPNGLLEVLGSNQFTPIGRRRPIVGKTDAARPLIVITTNRERAMPAAFLRRCLILDLHLPPYEVVDSARGDGSSESARENSFLSHFIELGRAHFGNQMPDDVYRDLAQLLHEDRENAENSQTGTKPGPAEFIDLLRAMHAWPEPSDPPSETGERDPHAWYRLLSERLRGFFFSNKYREF